MSRLRQPLFQTGIAKDPAYNNLRDLPENSSMRQFCEDLWHRYAPYADTHFLSEIRIKFDARFWEMYLGVAFLSRGYTLHKHREGGPEFAIDIEDKRFWFDAIAPNSGSGADAVPQLEFGKSEASVVPVEQIVLRVTGALATKRQKWADDLRKGRVSQSDGYIVAINVNSIRQVWLDSDMPHSVKALYGLGNIAVAIDPITQRIVDSKYLLRPTITKASGVSVSSQAFVSGECPEVSAVITSRVDAANLPGEMGGDFLVLHNNEPNVPLPKGSLRFAREYYLEPGRLCCTDWTKSARRP